jgi:hypothetical protein
MISLFRVVVLKLPHRYFPYGGLTLLVFFCYFSSFCQQVNAELVFTNPQLVTGPGSKTAGSDGAIYVFQNVTSGVDALVVVNGRSSAYVSLSTIDLAGPAEDPVNGTGFDNAWQPKVSCNAGNAGPNQSWWMEFQVSFVQHDDHTKPALVGEFYSTGLDIDGDGQGLNEYLSFFGLQSYTLEQNTGISAANIKGNMVNAQASGKEFDGPTKNYPGISTTAMDVMVTNDFLNTNSFIMRAGAKTGNHSTKAADRMYSLWFKNFTYTAPLTGSLPLSLISFTAQLKDENVILDWISEMQVNTSHFVVQRSLDGVDYDDDAIVFTQENSSVKKDYQFSDNINAVKAMLIYYRLKIVDLDGKYAYSKTVLVRLGTGQLQTAVLLYPNPVVSEVRITIPNEWQNKTIVYNLYNSSGSLMRQRTEENAGQTETMPIADLPAGLYMVNVMNGSQSLAQKLIKTNH